MIVDSSERRGTRSNRLTMEDEESRGSTQGKSRRGGRKKSSHNVLLDPLSLLPDPDDIDLVFDEDILMGGADEVELDEYELDGESSDDNVGSSSNSTTSSTANYNGSRLPPRGKSAGKKGMMSSSSVSSSSSSSHANYHSSGEKSGGSSTGGHHGGSAASPGSLDANRKRKSTSSARERNMRRLESNERERQRMHGLNDAFQVSSQDPDIILIHSFCFCDRIHYHYVSCVYHVCPILLCLLVGLQSSDVM